MHTVIVKVNTIISECDDGYFGYNCKEFCGGCFNHSCNRFNGSCGAKCKVGFSGVLCANKGKW